MAYISGDLPSWCPYAKTRAHGSENEGCQTPYHHRVQRQSAGGPQVWPHPSTRKVDASPTLALQCIAEVLTKRRALLEWAEPSARTACISSLSCSQRVCSGQLFEHTRRAAHTGMQPPPAWPLRSPQSKYLNCVG